ncbi:gluconokinase [Streptomyces sp. NPDC059866]|uniref:gluconokinase n=1 Tax=Streptomyces sp. NPDC059866 TaxID=3346978 RepID=UPI003662A082
MSSPLVVVVMGVTGTGNTAIGVLLAARLGVPYAEGDDFHPQANIAKMSSGVPLTDEDRWSWLDAIGAWARGRAGLGAVISGSALRRAYRDGVRAAAPGIVFVHLTGRPRPYRGAAGSSAGHFMRTTLLDSQLAVLEPLGPGEAGVAVDVSGSPEEITTRVVYALHDRNGPPPRSRSYSSQ